LSCFPLNILPCPVPSGNRIEIKGIKKIYK